MAKTKKDKPSFGGGDDTRGSAAWVYRSDADGKQSDAGEKTTSARKTSATRASAKGGASKAAAPAGAAAGPDAKISPAPDRMAAAHALVDRYVKYSTAAGLVPVPVVDVVAIAGTQVKMLGALAEHYGVPYSRERGKTLVATMLGGLMPSLAGFQMLKVFGPLAGMASVAGFAAATTYAVGHVFIAHFESGGTLLDLDIDVARRKLAAALSRRQARG